MSIESFEIAHFKFSAVATKAALNSSPNSPRTQRRFHRKPAGAHPTPMFAGDNFAGRSILAVKIEIDAWLIMSAKEILLEVAEKLSPDATIVDAIYELEFRQAVAEGLAELDRGEGIPIEQVKAKIASWAGK
jgi:predicted transcriptional regulator